MHYRCVFTLLKWLCARRIGLGWARDVFTIAYHMLMHFHAYIPYILYILIYWLWLMLFCVSLSLPLSLLFTLVASWHLNINLLRPGTLFILGHPLLLILLPHMFSSVMIKPEKTFWRTFFRRGIHSKCQVILSNFSNTDLPTVIHSRGWESLCDVLVTCPSVLIQKFYSNMHGFDFSVPLFVTCVWGTRIVVTPDIVSDMLHVPRVAHPNYPS